MDDADETDEHKFYSALQNEWMKKVLCAGFFPSREGRIEGNKML
jgi:hypothetical protein